MPYIICSPFWRRRRESAQRKLTDYDDKSVMRVLLRRWIAAGHNPSVNRICEDEKIGIRRFGPEDAEPLLMAARETADEICRWMVWGRADYSLEDSRAFIARSGTEWDKGTWYTFVVYGKKEGQFLGSIGLSSVDRVHGYAQVGYWVRRARRGEGIGAAAVRLAAGYAFGELGLHRLELIIPVGNQGSLAVAAKAGAVREGILKARVRLNGKYHDAAIYSLLHE
jgi:RimJ/RimL family protein N-acetyltransferase